MGSAASSLTKMAWSLGNVGVYSFFTLSGFVMVHVSWGKFGGWQESASFLMKRLIRIVPLYWIGTLLAVVYHKISFTHGEHDSWMELMCSLSFIPYQDSSSVWSPILPQGWTLNYETSFYLLFAAGLCMPRRFGLPMICAVLFALVLIGTKTPVPAVAYLASPVILWFAFGIALGTVWEHYGLSEPILISKPARLLEPIGDASYSLYLVHGFLVTLIFRIWMRTVGHPSFLIIPISVAVATTGAWFVYVMIEKPITQALTSAFDGKSAVARAAPLLRFKRTSWKRRGRFSLE